MVVLHNLQDLYLESARQATLNLPTIKQNYLKIDYGNSDVSFDHVLQSFSLRGFSNIQYISIGILFNH